MPALTSDQQIRDQQIQYPIMPALTSDQQTQYPIMPIPTSDWACTKHGSNYASLS
jgi:hypothetical protein